MAGGFEAGIATDGQAWVVIDGERRMVSEGGDVGAARRAVLDVVADAVRERGETCEVVVDDLGTSHVFAIHPDGSREHLPNNQNIVTAESSEGSGPAVVGDEKVDEASAEPGGGVPRRRARPASVTKNPVAAPVSQPVVAPVVGVDGVGVDGAVAGSRRAARAARPSFVEPPAVEVPPVTGWRGVAARFGVKIAPSEAELSERGDRKSVSQHVAGPRTIAVVNAKGGAGKTPATVCLSAVFAREGGGGVLAWDNNQTRGTLGWRTEQASHEGTVLDLLGAAESLLGTGARSADLSGFVHHQGADRFDVLRSKPSVVASEQRVTPDDVDRIHAVASKYYRLVFVDSGNDETDPAWQRMISHAHQLVIPVTTRDDTREVGALLLDALAERDERSAVLADNAVVVVSQAEAGSSRAALAATAEQFRPFVREVVTVPFDPALVSGLIRFDALQVATKRAWLRAAAAVGAGLR